MSGPAAVRHAGAAGGRKGKGGAGGKSSPGGEAQVDEASDDEDGARTRDLDIRGVAAGSGRRQAGAQERMELSYGQQGDGIDGRRARGQAVLVSRAIGVAAPARGLGLLADGGLLHGVTVNGPNSVSHLFGPAGGHCFRRCNGSKMA